MIDWTRLNELRAEIGEDGFGEVLDVFLEEAGEVIARLAHSPGTVAEDLHFLKGSALNLGFSEVAALCQDGERRQAKGEQPDLSGIARSFETARAEVIQSRFGRVA